MMQGRTRDGELSMRKYQMEVASIKGAREILFMISVVVLITIGASALGYLTIWIFTSVWKPITLPILVSCIPIGLLMTLVICAGIFMIDTIRIAIRQIPAPPEK